MRRWTIAWVIVFATLDLPAASAGSGAPIDLDATGEGTSRLAEAAGACAAQLPASMRQWCRRRGRPAREFVKRYSSIAATPAPGGAVQLAIPVEELGKGMTFSVIEPEVHCDDEICLVAPTAIVFVRSARQLDVSQIASATFSFRVGGMWRTRQWWGPRVSKVAVTLRDSRDHVIGEGTVLRRAGRR